MSSLNVGNLDRLLRIAIGLALVALVALGRIGPWGYAGVPVMLTGVAALCPLYTLLGLRTTQR